MHLQQTFSKLHARMKVGVGAIQPYRPSNFATEQYYTENKYAKRLTIIFLCVFESGQIQ